MAKKRGSRSARFATIRSFYMTNKAGLLTDEAAKANVEQSGFVIYDSELEKFAEEYPDIDINDFTEFLKKNSGHKVAGKKVTGTQRQYQLNTVDKANQLGVLPENQKRYIELVDMLYKVKTELQKLIPGGVVSLAIPVRQPKAVAVE